MHRLRQNSSPLSSCLGEQAALKSSCRRDSVTRGCSVELRVHPARTKAHFLRAGRAAPLCARTASLETVLGDAHREVLCATPSVKQGRVGERERHVQRHGHPDRLSLSSRCRERSHNLGKRNCNCELLQLVRVCAHATVVNLSHSIVARSCGARPCDVVRCRCRRAAHAAAHDHVDALCTQLISLLQ